MRPSLVVIFLSLLLGLQPVTTDLYLPALPGMRSDFAASMGQAQLTLTALLLAFGLSQLVWGPLSDRFGRRPILLVGMGLYVLSSIACTMASSMDTLILWRTLQGVAMGAGVVCARALLRDLYQPVEGAQVMSKGLTGLGVIACASAPLGGLLSGWFGWRLALLALAVFGGITLGLLAWRFEETLAKRNPYALKFGDLARTWWKVARHPTFVAYSALASASYGGLFTFLAASSFVFIQVFGYSTTRYGLAMFSMSFAYIVGTFWCRYLVPRIGVKSAISLASYLSLGSVILMVALAYAGVGQSWYGGWAILVPVYIFMLGHGVHQPCSQSGAVGPFPQTAGAASALNGFLMMVSAFAMGAWLGKNLDGTVFALVHGMAFWGVCIALTGWTLVKRHG